MKDPRGVGIAGVIVDLYDPVANARATALQNVTLATGQFNALFTPTDPAATFFYVDFAPPGGTGHAAVQQKDWRFAGATVVMPDVILPDAVAVQVDVFDPTGTLAQANVDLDVYEVTTGAKAYTPGAVTGGGGNVSVDLAPGLYDLLLTPPRAGPFGPAALRSQRVTVPTTLAVNLTNGALVTGTVTDPLGAPVDRAALRIVDAATGLDVATRYLSNAGTISLFLAPGTYDVTVQPPAGTDLLSARLPAMTVPGAAWNVVLPRGVAVTGRVVDGLGTPVWEAGLDVEDAASGTGLDLVRARADSTGAFSLVLPAGRWTLTASPPVGSRLLPKVVPGVVVDAAPVNVGTVVLGTGFVVTGRVTGAGQPVPDVNTSVADPRTGNTLATANDHSDWNGNFRVVVPPGTWDFGFVPPRGTAWQAAERNAVVVSADLALAPDVVLVAGATVTATVLGRGAGPLEGASLRLVDPLTGDQARLPHASSTSLGTVSTQAPTGNFVPRVLPPSGTDWLATELLAIPIGPGATALGPITLDRGALLDGVVASALTGVGIDDVNVNLFDPATGAQQLTARDHSDWSGHYVVAATAGTHDVEFLPPAGTRFLPATLAGVVVAAGGTTLPDVLLDEGVLLSGRTLDAPAGTPVVDVNLEVDDVATGPLLTSHDHSVSDGTFETVVPPGTYDLVFIPPVRDPHVVTRLAATRVNADTDLGDVLLARGFAVGGRVHDAGGTGIADVVVSARVTGGGPVVELARNVSDGAGFVDWMVLPAGSVDLTLTPRPGSGFRATTITVAVSVENHALFDVTLPEAPRVVALSPPSGTCRGGTLVTLTGTGFTALPTSALLGGMPLTGLTLASATTITGTTAAHPAGLVDLRVTFPGDPEQALAGAFRYVEPVPAPVLRVRRLRSGTLPTPDLELSWTGGSAPFAVFRADAFPAWQRIGGAAPASPLTLPGEVGTAPLVFYAVE